MMQAESSFSVRYAETDQMGIVHHSNFAVWFEVGRTDLLKMTGIPTSDIEAEGIILPLYELSCQFKSPAKYEDDITVITRIDKITPVRLCFSYEVFQTAQHRLLATGTTLHAWTDRELRPVNAAKRIPDIYFTLEKLTK